MRRLRPHRGESGFTLLEMVVVTVLVFTALLLAADLFQEAVVISKAAGGELTSPLTGAASAKLRSDLQGASSVMVSQAGWSTGPLMLVGREGGVAYGVEEDQLVRVVFDVGDAEIFREVLFPHLVSWRWQVTGSRLVEVHWTYAKSAEIDQYRLDGRPHRPAPGLVSESFLLALRGTGKGRGW